MMTLTMTVLQSTVYAITLLIAFTTMVNSCKREFVTSKFLFKCKKS